jgi:hypothetical protein
MTEAETLTSLWRQLYELGGPEVIRAIVHLSAEEVTAKRYGTTLLHIAAGGRYGAEVEWLIAQGADVNATDADGQTPLHGAASNSDPTTCSILLKHGALLAHRDRNGKTPLDLARRGDVWAFEEDYLQTIALLEATK